MKNGRTNAHQSRRHQNRPVTRRQRQRHQADQSYSHANRQEIRTVVPVAVQPNQRLQQRSSKSSSERNQTDLSEIQMKRIAQQRINRRQQRLHRVIQQMTKTNSQQNLENSFRPNIPSTIGNKCAHFA